MDLAPAAVASLMILSGCAVPESGAGDSAPSSPLGLRVETAPTDATHDRATYTLTLEARRPLHDVRYGLSWEPRDGLVASGSPVASAAELKGEHTDTLELRATRTGSWLVRAWAEGWSDAEANGWEGFTDLRYVPVDLTRVDYDGATLAVTSVEPTSLPPAFEVTAAGPGEATRGSSFEVTVRLEPGADAPSSNLGLAWTENLRLTSGQEFQHVQLTNGTARTVTATFEAASGVGGQVRAYLYPDPAVSAQSSSASASIRFS